VIANRRTRALRSTVTTPVHSLRKAVSGSTRNARRAAGTQASSATAASNSDKEARQSEGAHHAEQHAAERERERGPEHRAQHGGRRSAERDSNPELARALRDGIGDHAVDSDRREQQRNAAE
jgi:hypothetical protein